MSNLKEKIKTAEDRIKELQLLIAASKNELESK